MNVIEQGIENLERYGWVQGHFGNETKGFCMLGSLGLPPLHLAEGEEFVACMSARDVLHAELVSRGLDVRSVEYFNDEVATSVDEVIDIMKYAAKRLDSGS